MSEPPRLLDSDASEAERSVLRAGVEEVPSDAWMHQTRVGLGIATGVVAASTLASTAAAAKWTAPTLLKWLGGLLSAALVFGGASFAVHRQMQMDRAHQNAPDVAAQLPSITDRPAVEPAPSVADETPPDSPPPSNMRPDHATAATNAPRTLTAEIAALDAVKKLLIEEDAAAALNALAQYHRSFPTPMLAPEATVLEVQALMAQGDGPHRTRAIALARRFVKMHPTSPHASQLEALLAKSRDP